MPRKKTNSARVNLLFSIILHTLAVVSVMFFAAHEGLMGRHLQELTAVIVPKEKPPEIKPEPKVEPPHDEPKEQQPEPTPAAAPAQVAAAAPPPAGPAAVAPAAIAGDESFFSDGAKDVVTATGTNAAMLFYKNYVEFTLRAAWNRPENIDDANFVAEVAVSVNPEGRIIRYEWEKKSGNKQWDDSVAQVLSEVKTMSRNPPKGFPSRMLVRFDVVAATQSEEAVDPISTLQ